VAERFKALALKPSECLTTFHPFESGRFRQLFLCPGH
jgi:chaperonin GroES